MCGASYVAGRGELAQEFQEVETGKGRNALEQRPHLRAALDACKKMNATLLIAKLDRLARNVHFVSGLIESGCDFIAVDMPNANKVMIQMHAVMAEYERIRFPRARRLRSQRRRHEVCGLARRDRRT